MSIVFVLASSMQRLPRPGGQPVHQLVFTLRVVNRSLLEAEARAAAEWAAYKRNTGWKGD
jgi:hypothetical protein